MNKFQDVNLYRIGSVVDIDSIESLQGVTIISINDSGVAVKGSLCGSYHTISGKSPARLAEVKVIVPELNDKGEVIPARCERKKNNVALDIKIPEVNLFTIKQLAEFNGLTPMQLTTFIKEKCEPHGFADKMPGKRGKCARVFALKST